MKRNLVNFTRGSQLLGHFGFMFAAGLKGPLIIAVIALGWMSWWTLSSELSDHEIYLVWMRAYAAIYGFMEFDPAKQIVVETAFRSAIKLPISAIDTYPPVAAAWDHMLSLIRTALIRAAMVLLPAFAAFYWFAARFGSRSKERKHERGAMLVTLPELVEELRNHNDRERTQELSLAMGWKWRLCRPSELATVFPYRPSHLAAVTYPWRLEPSHAMLIGTTGMGKTVAMSDMIEEARSRRQRCVVFDLTGAFIEHFHYAGRDVILNPLDARCPRWNLFDECRTEGEFWAAAEALVPHDGGGEAQFWVIAARALFVEFCLKLIEEGAGTNEALAQRLMTADLSQVHAMMRGTIADPLTAPEAARMAESIRAVFNVNAKALKLLPTSGPRFSIRDWIEEDDGSGSVVFISARYVDMSVCAQMLTLWLDTAMNTLMTLPRTRDLKCWFFIDELGALHRLPALEKGLQTARNFGGAIVTGIHAYAKLKEVYGENMAMTLSSLARTKLILGTADRETATWCSDFIGHRQVRDMEEGYTYGYNNARDAVSLTPRKLIEPLLLPDQLMNLQRLSGYIKFPDGFPAAPVRLKPVGRPKVAETFIGRAKDRVVVMPVSPQPRPAGQTVVEAPASPDHPSTNDDGAGKPVVPKQGNLPLEPGFSAQDRKEEQDATKQGTRRPDPTSEPAREANPRKAGKGGGSPSKGGKPGPVVPKNAVVRKGSGAADSTPRSDAPMAKPPANPDPAVQQQVPRQNAGDARKLMIEDGVPEQEPPSPSGPDLGDVEL